jgi:hypothetical protein
VRARAGARRPSLWRCLLGRHVEAHAARADEVVYDLLVLLLRARGGRADKDGEGCECQEGSERHVLNLLKGFLIFDLRLKKSLSP